MLIFNLIFNCFLFSFLFIGTATAAPNNCPQIQEALEKACKQIAPDLCELRDEMMFQKLLRLAERTPGADRLQFEKYQNLLKGPPTQTTLQNLAMLQEEVSSCVMHTHSLWTLLLKQGATKAFRKISVQNLIQKKLLSTDLYSFTLESLRQRVSLIQDANAFNLLIMDAHQSRKWNEVVQGLRVEKDLPSEANSQPVYSEKSAAEKVRPPTADLTKLNALFQKVRATHQKINEIF